MRNNVGNYNPGYGNGYYYQRPVRKYGLIKFLFDLLMVTITGGLWLIWIFVREMRNR